MHEFVKENVLQVRLESGFVYVVLGGDTKDTLKVETDSLSDGRWHFISVAKTSKIKIYIDDLHSNEAYVPVDYDEVHFIIVFSFFDIFRKNEAIIFFNHYLIKLLFNDIIILFDNLII